MEHSKINAYVAKTADNLGATVAKSAEVVDVLHYTTQYTFTCTEPAEGYRDEFIRIRDEYIATEGYIDRNRELLSQHKAKGAAYRFVFTARRKVLEAKLSQLLQKHTRLFRELKAVPQVEKWSEVVNNLIPTVGKNNMLDNHLAGSAYTASWFMGLIDNASFTAVAVGDTSVSHAGWIESTAYSNATRIAAAWSAASGGVKSLSAALGFLINATATINGGFLISVNTKGGTTGIITSEASFTGGNRAVINGDTLNVSASVTLT